MALFELQGYQATTIPQIVERAGLTTRTFFRHFTDKRDVLFLRDREFPAVIADSLSTLPVSLDAVELVEHGLLVAADELDGLRDAIARRRSVIRSDALLRERELLKLDLLGDAIRAALTDRGIPSRDASLLSRVATLTFDLSMERWLDGAATRTLQAVMTETWADLRGALRD